MAQGADARRPILLHCIGRHADGLGFEWFVEIFPASRFGVGYARSGDLNYELFETPVEYTLKGPIRPPDTPPEKWAIPLEWITINRITGSYRSMIVDEAGRLKSNKAYHWSGPGDQGCIPAKARF